MTDPSIQATPPDPAPYPDTLPPRTLSGFAGLPLVVSFYALHAVLWCALAAYLLLFVPPAEKTFRDFNMVLPEATRVTLAVARWVGNYWYILPFWLIVFLAADGGLLILFRRQRRRFLAWVWALFNVVLPMVLGLLAFFAIQVPMWKLLDALNR